MIFREELGEKETQRDVWTPFCQSKIFIAEQHVNQTLVCHKFIMEIFLALDFFKQAKADVILKKIPRNVLNRPL